MVYIENKKSRENENLLKKQDITLTNWLDLETLILSIASRFLGDLDLNEAINGSLRDIGIISEVSHSFIFLFNKDKSQIKNTHEWCNEGCDSQIKALRKLKSKDFPWLIEQLISGKSIQIDNVLNLPYEASSIKELFEILKIKSILIFPFYAKKELSGFIGFDVVDKARVWRYLDFSILRLSSQIIGNALERLKIEQLLEESKDKYRLIIENIDNIIFILDLRLKFEYINQNTVFKLLGYKEKEILRNFILSFVHSNDCDLIVEKLSQKSQNNKSNLEIRLRHKNGKFIWFECESQSFIDNNKKSKWLLLLRDISDRKIAEEKYKSLFENSPNAILLIDFKGIIVDCNSTAKYLFNRDKQYFINKSINQLNDIFSLDLKKYFKDIFQASFKNDFPKPLEVKIKEQGNNLVWFEVQASSVKQAHKTLIQLIFQDISQKKRAEILEKKFTEELEKKVDERTQELYDALEKQNLYLDQILKSSQFKTEFMATMSHELRTPLNAIIGFAELLVEGFYGQLNEEQKEFIIDIKSSAEHQFEMIKHILDISKIESGQITLNVQQFSLNAMLEQLKSSLRPLYSKKGLKFKVKGLDTEKYINADPIRFREILLNLLSNAIKFTMDGKVTLKVDEKYNYWLFKVTDTGIGIARKDFPLIFKEFKRVNSPYVRSVPGTGLGLSLTKRLIELHGGEISFTSLLGAGSTFTFSISKKLEEKYHKLKD